MTMAKINLTFIVPRIQLPGIFRRLEAEDAPEHEARIRRFRGDKVVCDIVKDGQPGGCCEVAISTDQANYNYFAHAVGGGRR